MDIAEANAAAFAKIKERCHAARLTPAKLCDRAGIARQTYWRADKGNMTLDTLRKLETALDEVENESRAKAA